MIKMDSETADSGVVLGAVRFNLKSSPVWNWPNPTKPHFKEWAQSLSAEGLGDNGEKGEIGAHKSNASGDRSNSQNKT